MQVPRRRVLAAAAVLGFLSAGAAYAGDTRLPSTGAEQGAIVPNASPGVEAPHARPPEGHLIAPTGLSPRVGSVAGVEPANAQPGSARHLGEAQPHADVRSPPGLVPQSNEGAPRPSGSR